MLLKRTCLIGAITAACAAAAAPASATVAVSSFTLTPSTTQAGAAPSLTLDAGFAPSAGDDPQSITLALAPGLLANPTVPATCSQSQLSANACPAGSQIGSGSVTGTLAGLSLSSPATMYLVTPQSGEIGRVGMVISTPTANAVVQGPITLRTQPDVGADITFTNLPQTIAGLPVTVTGMHVTMPGTIGGTAFTRNPTSCAPANSTLSVTSYGTPATPVTAGSAFTPTGCATLPFAPKLSGTAAVAGWDGATALATTLAQGTGDAGTRGAQLTLPSGLWPRYDAFSRACTAVDPASCPTSATVGTATVVTPLLASPLSGRVVLVSHSGSLPGLAVVFPAPFGLTLAGTTTLSGSSLQTSFQNLPDLPLSSLQIALSGGSDSLLYNGYSLCVGSPSVSASLTAQSGASASASGPVALTGCPF